MLVVIPALPFTGFLVLAAAGRRFSKAAGAGLACATVAAALAASVWAAWPLVAGGQGAALIREQTLYTWIASGDFAVPFTLHLDSLAAVMILVVTGVGSFIHVYSIGYMHEESDAEYARYFSYLNLFTAFMLLLVLAANFLVLFIGWEGVGLSSYLLIGFWFGRPAAAIAGKKAFIVNRVGDFAFLLGILLIAVTFATLDFQRIGQLVATRPVDRSLGTTSLIALLLFIGVTGKSAQLPLYVWLPDAMEGPTPVSALIHAATMVTAGVYLIARNAVLFSHAPSIMVLVAVTGAVTAFFAATVALVQHDIKRVLAYSTISQLGYMVLAMGVGAFTAGIFHLVTHAFFKATLFLGAGAIMHALGGEQDLRRMGGLRARLPLTYWTFLAGALALAGVPFFSGFFSKDEILLRTFMSGHLWLWGLAAATSLLTALYIFRAVFLAFHGRPAAPAGGPGLAQAAVPQRHPVAGPELHDPPLSMALALVVLATGAVLAGALGVPHALGGTNRIEQFLDTSFPATAVSVSQAPRPITTLPGPARGRVSAQERPSSGNGETEPPRRARALLLLSAAIAFAGVGCAAWIFLWRPAMATGIEARFPRVSAVLQHTYYIDDAYDVALVRPIRTWSERVLWRRVDVALVDGAVNGAGALVRRAADAFRRLQTGSVRVYALSLAVGVLIVLGYLLGLR